MSTTILYLADYKIKTIEFIECRGMTFRFQDDQRMFVEIEGGSCNGDRLIVDAWGHISIYEPKKYKDFEVGKIARVPIGEAVQQESLFKEDK